MSFSSFGVGPTGRASGLKGTGYKQVSMPTQDSRQSQLTDMLHNILGSGGLQQGLSQASRLAGGDQSQFDQLEAPALRQHSALLGNLASRFSGMGSGARNSSGFQNTASEASTDLAERLASQRMGYQQQALQQLLGLSESLLNRPTFQSGLVPKKTPGWQTLLAGLGGIGGQVGGGLGTMGLAKLFGIG